jgi:GAF domain-containing protein
MSATSQASRPVPLNRRRRVRQKVHAPAYASFSGASKSEMLDLYEVLDISEVGVAVQCTTPLEASQQVELCLDLAEASGQISATARVVWSDESGRVGLALPVLTSSALHRLREWLFLNAMAGAANAASAAPEHSGLHSELRPTYTDTLTAASAVQREAESLGSDLEAVLALVASRSQSLLRASGAAIALAGKNAGTMICRASAGPSAPPVGTALQVGSGFSGECVRTGKMLRCDDAATDQRVDRESCRDLGISSMLAAPIRLGEKVVGLLEVFSPQPGAFSENDGAVLQRFAETIVTAINRAARAHDPTPPPPSSRKPYTAPPGSVLFAHVPEETSEKKDESGNEDEDKVGGIRLPRAHLYLLICVAATIFLALGFISAPWIQPWIQEKLQARRIGEQTVLASSRPPAETSKPATEGPSLDSASPEQLREMAERGDAAAEDRLGRLYAEGDEKQGIKPDDKAAAHWFTSAAEHGSVSAQYKLGLLYWGGHHGLPKDPNKAYFWTVLARAGGQEGSKDLATFLATGMTRAQAAAIEQQAEIWYRQHEPQAKPNPGH